jgi:hypothetical protein
MVVEVATLGLGGEKCLIDGFGHCGVIVDLAGTEFEPKTPFLWDIEHPKE